MNLIDYLRKLHFEHLRKRRLRTLRKLKEGTLRTRPHTSAELEREIRESLIGQTYKDNDGVTRKIEKVSKIVNINNY